MALDVFLLLRNYDQIKRNYEKVDYYLKKGTKKGKLAAYLLGGQPVSGRLMIDKFAIYSYRDAIYDLSKEGLNIKSKVITNKGVSHKVWWLAEFDFDFIWRRHEFSF